LAAKKEEKKKEKSFGEGDESSLSMDRKKERRIILVKGRGKSLLLGE